MKTLSILLVDKSQLFREGLRRILADTVFRIDLEGASLMDLLQADVEDPDLLLFDFDSVDGDMREQLDALREAHPGLHTVVLTDRVCIGDFAAGLAARIDGYLLKNMSVEALRQSLSLIVMGLKIYPAEVTHLLINERIVTEPGAAELAQGSTITEREKQILAGLLNGLSNKSIANNLGIAEATVKALLKSVLRKIGMRNRTQAAIWALTHGIAADAFALCDPREDRLRAMRHAAPETLRAD